MSKRLDEIYSRLEKIKTETYFLGAYTKVLTDKNWNAAITGDMQTLYDSMNKKKEILKRSEELKKEVENLKAAYLAIAATEFLEGEA